MTSDSREVCALCVQWRCEICQSRDWPECCEWATGSEPYWPDGTVAVITLTDSYCEPCQEMLDFYEARKEP